MASSFSLRGDPIIAAERLYQERSIGKRRARWWWAIPRQVFLTLAWFSVVFVIVAQFGDALNLIEFYEIPADFGIQALSIVCWLLIPGLALLPTTLILHFGLQLRTLLWTSNSITREKTTGTWDLLLLSGVDSRRLIRGKWWATVHRALPAYLRLALLRWAVILWVFEVARLDLGWGYYQTSRLIDFNGYYQSYSIWLLLLAGALVLVFTLLNLCFTAAVGMFTALLTRRSVFNLVLGGVIRAVTLALPGIITIVVSIIMSFSRIYIPYELPWRLVPMFIGTLSFTLGDNGMVFSGATVLLIQSFAQYPYDEGLWSMFAGFVGLLVAMLYYLLGSLLGLFWAERLARRQEALPPLRGKRT